MFQRVPATPPRPRRPLAHEDQSECKRVFSQPSSATVSEFASLITFPSPLCIRLKFHTPLPKVPQLHFLPTGSHSTVKILYSPPAQPPWAVSQSQQLWGVGWGLCWGQMSIFCPLEQSFPVCHREPLGICTSGSYSQLVHKFLF